MIVRATFGCLLLVLAGLNALISFNGDTCSQNSPDSLFGFVVTLPLNIAGMALLAWKPRSIAVIVAIVIPVLLAIPYTLDTARLLAGTPACTILTGTPDWEPSGEEAVFMAGWGASVLIFWLGLAYALLGGYRPVHDRDADDRT